MSREKGAAVAACGQRDALSVNAARVAVELGPHSVALARVYGAKTQIGELEQLVHVVDELRLRRREPVTRRL